MSTANARSPATSVSPQANAISVLDFCSQLGPSVQICVGADEDAFYIPKHLFRTHSNYFKAALDGDWKEAMANLFRLPDIHPRFFAIFVYWLYHQKIALDPLEDSELPDALRVGDYCLDSMKEIAA